MLAAFRRWRALQAGTSSAAIVIIALPLVIFPMFAFGFDTMRLVYAKRYAQGRLDLAVQQAAAVTWTDQAGRIRLGTPTDGTNGQNLPGNAAITTAYNLYSQNTTSKRAPGSTTRGLFSCATGTVTAGTNPTSMGRPDPGSTAPTCAGVARVTGTPPPTGFNFCQNPGYWNNMLGRPTYGIQYVVYESTPTVFMRYIGVNNFTYMLKGEALMRQRNC